MTNEIYRARISMLVRMFNRTGNVILCGPDGFSINMFSVGLVVTILLVTGVEVKPGPSVDDKKLDPILQPVKNHQLETETIVELIQEHSQEIPDTTKTTDALGTKYEFLNEFINSVINDYNQTKQVKRRWE